MNYKNEFKTFRSKLNMFVLIYPLFVEGLKQKENKKIKRSLIR